MSKEPRLSAVATSDLVSASILVSLIGMLASKGVLTDEETRKIYENALLLLEQQQGESPETAHI